MNQKTTGLLIGGILAALLFGLSGVLQKVSNQHGISLGPYMVFTGVAITLLGAVFWIISGEGTFNVISGSMAASFGTFWALGTICIAVALVKYKASISQLVPLYNMNTLIAIAIGLFVLGEYKHVDIRYLLPGAVAIVLGGWLCGKA
jgi:uncharacterized membrane protein